MNLITSKIKITSYIKIKRIFFTFLKIQKINKFMLKNIKYN